MLLCCMLLSETHEEERETLVSHAPPQVCPVIDPASPTVEEVPSSSVPELETLSFNEMPHEADSECELKLNRLLDDTSTVTSSLFEVFAE